MDDFTSRALVSDPETRRALQLHALFAILPMERRDRLAELLTDDDIARLKHLAREGIGENSLRALACDLAYLEGWAKAATGAPLPAPESLALKYVAHHLWDPAERETDPQHGMPAEVAADIRSALLLRADGPHAPSTVKHRLANWGTLHRWKGEEGPFHSPSLRTAVRLAVPGQPPTPAAQEQASRHPGVLDRLLATCRSDRLVDTRDLAILLLAFASGGRRRSAAPYRPDQRRTRGAGRSQGPPIADVGMPWRSSSAGPRRASRTMRGGCSWSGRRSRRCANGLSAPTSARVHLPRHRLREAIRGAGADPQSINLIVKRRCAMAGLEPREFSTHGLEVRVSD